MGEVEDGAYQWRSMAELGSIIARTRRDQGLRQEDLAIAANISRAALIAIERGKPTARIDAVIRLLDALGLESQSVPRDYRALPAVDGDAAHGER
jgi:transcriptional regulator with XRE-family HTH domain